MNLAQNIKITEIDISAMKAKLHKYFSNAPLDVLVVFSVFVFVFAYAVNPVELNIGFLAVQCRSNAPGVS